MNVALIEADFLSLQPRVLILPCKSHGQCMVSKAHKMKLQTCKWDSQAEIIPPCPRVSAPAPPLVRYSLPAVPGSIECNDQQTGLHEFISILHW
jgi:hypothetical protein